MAAQSREAMRDASQWVETYAQYRVWEGSLQWAREEKKELTAALLANPTHRSPLLGPYLTMNLTLLL